MTHLPTFGIVAFSLASTWALVNLFNGNALHPHPLYWLPAALIELVNAWIVYQGVQVFRKMTQSRISKQDKRFYRSAFAVLFLLALPTLAVSVWANTVELGNVLLGLLFPASSLGCAVTGAIPAAMDGHEERKQQEAKRKEQEKQVETEWKEAERQRQEMEREQKILEMILNERETLRYFVENPTATKETAAKALGITRRTVSNHLERLEQAQAISRGNGRVEALVEV